MCPYPSRVAFKAMPTLYVTGVVHTINMTGYITVAAIKSSSATTFIAKEKKNSKVNFVQLTIITREK